MSDCREKPIRPLAKWPQNKVLAKNGLRRKVSEKNGIRIKADIVLFETFSSETVFGIFLKDFLFWSGVYGLTPEAVFSNTWGSFPETWGCPKMYTIDIYLYIIFKCLKFMLCLLIFPVKLLYIGWTHHYWCPQLLKLLVTKKLKLKESGGNLVVLKKMKR